MVTALVRFALLLLLALAASRDLEACSCDASGPPCQNFFQVQAVFAGTVRSITPAGVQPPEGSALRVEFGDAITYRGADGATQTVLTAVNGASCGYPFKVGERYVVYAFRLKPDAPLRVVVCSRTRPIAEAGDDLVFFKSLSATPSGPRVSGSITHSEFNLARRDIQRYGPVPNARLILRNATTTRTATTDAAGRYDLPGLAPAIYELTVEPPGEFSTANLKRTIRLDDSRGCAEANFVLRFNGRVSGSIRAPGGDPVANVRVQMMPIEHVDTKNVPETIDVTTDAGGRFEFREVSPGRYVLGVDLFRMSEMQQDPAGVFPLTYHPGTADAINATIVELSGGERHELEPMTLPAPRRPYQLTGTVTLKDGTPAVGVSVILLDGNRKWLDVAPPVETDSSGAFSFVVHEGLSYIVSAAYQGRDALGQRQTPTTVGPFVVTNAPLPLRVVVAARR